MVLVAIFLASLIAYKVLPAVVFGDPVTTAFAGLTALFITLCAGVCVPWMRQKNTAWRGIDPSLRTIIPTAPFLVFVGLGLVFFAAGWVIAFGFSEQFFRRYLGMGARWDHVASFAAIMAGPAIGIYTWGVYDALKGSRHR